MISSTGSGTVKQRIASCAVRLFATKGYANTSVREIVEAAGVTKPVLYYYYKNKDGLYLSLVNETLDDFHEYMDGPGSGGRTLSERLRRVLEIHFEYIRHDPMMAKFIFAAVLGIAIEAPKIDLSRHILRNRQYIYEILKRAVHDGEIPAKSLCDVVVTQFSGVVNVYMLRSPSGPRRS